MRRPGFRYLSIAVALWTAALAGCSGYIERRAAESTVAITRQSRVAVQRLADVQLAREATPGGLIQLEAFALAYPDQRGFLALLAEGYCQYAVGFLNDDWDAAVLRGDLPTASALMTRTLGLLDRCIDYGLQLLGPRWQRAHRAGPAPLQALVAGARAADVEGMGWVALGLATAVSMNPLSGKRRALLPVAQALLERIVALQPDHRDATAHVLLGAIHSARSRLLGGDPPAGRKHFERARALTGGGALLVDVMLARTYAVTPGDRQLFRQALERVLAADPTRWPERRLVNEMARRKARRYLDVEDRFF